MELPLDLTRTLAAVVESGSLEAAAGRLSVTPSAVSQRLKTLESQLGRVLLVRTKPVQPTAAGQALIRLARQLDALEHDTLAELGLTESGPVEVPLAVNADSLATWFLPALAPLAGQGIVFDLHRDDQDFTAGLLESGTVSAAVTSSEHPVAGCSVRRLGAMRYLPVATPGFTEQWFGTEDAAAYERAPLLDFDRRDGLQTRYLTSVGADPTRPPRHHVPASNDFARACELGFGWALVPEHQSVPAIRDARLVRLAGAPVDVPLFWQRWKLRSPLLEQIEDAVVDGARHALRQ
ncbi:LysR family transcriptional regulator [Propionicimonas paludicola]|uniref:LysR family transcriptional regulator n=1 Tax=Propionicimonas paludicola TaxID=185243 RepID=A0A2A9CMJ8_9ACTN|nr:LysR family transcriptional regulator ArgP [Propionicimonas paludicola]PFG15687.1 LysR family transcriptional regulator [Propionicimonas paludicola]